MARQRQEQEEQEGRGFFRFDHESIGKIRWKNDQIEREGKKEKEKNLMKTRGEGRMKTNFGIFLKKTSKKNIKSKKKRKKRKNSKEISYFILQELKIYI